MTTGRVGAPRANWLLLGREAVQAAPLSQSSQAVLSASPAVASLKSSGPRRSPESQLCGRASRTVHLAGCHLGAQDSCQSPYRR